MPTYTYRCLDDTCYDVQDVFHHMGESPQVMCSVCGGLCKRIIVETPHVAFDWKAYDKRETQRRQSLHAGFAGRSSPTSEQAGRRT